MMTTGLIVFLAVELLLPLVLFIARDRVIFLPSKSPSAEAGLAWADPSTTRLVKVVRTDGRRLAAYDLQPRTADEQPPVVLFFHGNAGNIAQRVAYLERFAEQTAARVLMPDYSGYGGNPGSPTEAEVYLDGLAAYDHLAAQGVAASRMVLYGESLGGAVALAVAQERPVAGIVLQSTFSSASSMARKVWPWLPLTSLLARGTFPNTERLQSLTTPAWIVHGTEDRIVPPSEAEKLYRTASEAAELRLIQGAGHNDLLDVGGAEYLEQLAERFRSWTAEGEEANG